MEIECACCGAFPKTWVCSWLSGVGELFRKQRKKIGRSPKSLLPQGRAKGCHLAVHLVPIERTPRQSPCIYLGFSRNSFQATIFPPKWISFGGPEISLGSPEISTRYLQWRSGRGSQKSDWHTAGGCCMCVQISQPLRTTSSVKWSAETLSLRNQISEKDRASFLEMPLTAEVINNIL